MASDREELMALRRLAELEAKAKGGTSVTPEQQPAAGKTRLEMGFTERIGDDVKRRYQNVQEKKQLFKQGKFPAVLVGTKAVTQAGMVASDILGEGLVETFRQLPGPIEKPLRAAGGMIGKAAQPILQPIAEKYGEIKKEHPILTSAAEDVANVGMLYGTLKPSSVTKPVGEGSLKTGGALLKAGESQAVKKRTNFLEDLVRPETTKRKAGTIVSRTTEQKNLIKSKVIAPTKEEAAIVNEVSKLKDVSPKNTFQGNYNVIAREVSDEAEKLSAALKQNDVPILHARVMKNLGETKNRLKKEITLSGDASEIADVMLQKFKQLLGNKTETASDVFEARKQFDVWLNSQKDNFFDPKLPGGGEKYVAATQAGLAIRKTINDLIAERVTDVNVLSSLNKQHNLLSAMDNIVPKAFTEGPNRIARAWNKVEKALTLKGAMIGAGGLVLGGAGIAVSPAVPPLMLAGGVFYLGGKAMTSSQTKKLLGGVLKTSGKMLGAKEKTAIKQIMDNLPAEQAAKAPLLIPPPEKMSRLPMTERQIAIEQAKIRAFGAGNTPGITPLSVKPTPTPEQVPMKLLPPPKADYVGTRSGILKKASGSEMSEAIQKRMRSFELGLSPDIYKTISKREMRAKFDPIFARLNAKQQKEIQKQINQAWKEHRGSIEEIIQQANQRARDLADAGVTQGIIMREAFSTAKPAKKGILNAPDKKR